VIWAIGHRNARNETELEPRAGGHITAPVLLTQRARAQTLAIPSPVVSAVGAASQYPGMAAKPAKSSTAGMTSRRRRGGY
jgi:hypothetical protein